MVKEVAGVLAAGKCIGIAGNGGSAAEAMHIAAEFTGKCVIPHEPLNVLCLNDSQSAITAIGNDYGFDEVFSRMIKAHLKAGDLLILLSTSGRSSNITKAISVASELGLKIFLWTGLDCPEYEAKNLTIVRVSSTSTPRIQEVHLIWGHLMAEIIEEIYLKEKG
jgi:D-sedoheptulose 7-phosphate isomerase